MPQMFNGWYSTETPIPKDGTKVDVWQGGRRVVDVYWSDIQEAFCIDSYYGPEEPTPLAIIPEITHWRPRPESPYA